MLFKKKEKNPPPLKEAWSTSCLCLLHECFCFGNLYVRY